MYLTTSSPSPPACRHARHERPVGLNSDGLPIGLQLLGKPFEEAALLNAGWRSKKKRTSPPCRS